MWVKLRDFKTYIGNQIALDDIEEVFFSCSNIFIFLKVN
jgi:hypothetical protein